MIAAPAVTYNPEAAEYFTEAGFMPRMQTASGQGRLAPLLMTNGDTPEAMKVTAVIVDRWRPA